jgi:hypothetical protein
MVYPIEKSRIPATVLTDVQDAVADPNAVLRYVPAGQDIAANMAAIPRDMVPDLPDRIVAATAHFMAYPC